MTRPTGPDPIRGEDAPATAPAARRAPLRPLARILAARRRGENPDAIERENIRLRHESQRDRLRQRAELRLLLLVACVLGAFVTVGFKMSVLAASDPEEPRHTEAGTEIVATRADIVDRQGRVLATNLLTNALYAHPHQIVDAEASVAGLVGIFPDLDGDRLLRQFTDPDRRFVWIRRAISPEQQQRVHDLGEPGLLFGPREMRLYPNGAVAAHVLGGAGFGQEGVSAAEIVGVAGIEAFFDAELRDPAREGALQLSLDLTIQSAVEEVLDRGMTLMGARAGVGVLMEAETGEIVALASLPDFDPNNRPAPPVAGAATDSPLFNRAVQGLYELGSTFKIFTIAQALAEGVVTPGTMIDTTGPLRMAGFAIRDFRDYGPSLSVEDVIVRSSNIGTARIAMELGAERQRRFLSALGLLDPSQVEVVEAPDARPLTPGRWGQLSTMTISYGHGVSTSPLHLAAAYAAMVNGGRAVTPTLLEGAGGRGPRVIPQAVSAQVRQMLRAVVTEGTASFGEVEGYLVGGKTGTADMPRADGRGYHEDRTITTFAAAFPMDDPEYVLVVTMMEPEIMGAGQLRRTAGWTAVPVAAEIIRRTAPLLGLRPDHIDVAFSQD